MSADLLVAGGGPAGMSAAIAAAGVGLSVTLIDEGFALGGQIYRPPTVTASGGPQPHPVGVALRRRIEELGNRITRRSPAVAFGIFAGLEVGVTADERTELLRPRAVVIAAGAHEFVPPFPGWTLPGVMTPGAAQIMVKTMGLAPGRRVLVAGTGPFLLAVAVQLCRAGVRVVAVLEASSRWPWLCLPFHGFRTPRLLLEGLGYLAELRRYGVPVRHRRVVVEAVGSERLTEVRHAPVDNDWVADHGRMETEVVDTLTVGYGFVPRVALAQQAGCELEFRAEVGGWIPRRDHNLATTVPGIYAAGDGAGVAGALTAALEGRLAGLAAAVRLGALTLDQFGLERRVLDRDLARIAPLRRALDRISLPRPGLERLVRDDTIVCRCEEVPWSEARAGIRAGGLSFRRLKVITRAGMGACQGRFCWPALARQVSRELGCSVQTVGPASSRPPIRPVTLGSIANAIEESRS